ncbi:hypothetical protein ISN44_As09g002380 [Arabidopsis suecica]|uniref:Uncharacterized protein n=1 Tax=Arabidopsis suecica TaxID=45249 RepID=A0A8T2AGD9_ARASU|nr:hypothetical protein ISN44_As13g006560 [Arabidopsis suecica]KAG7571827.1 hypothetical protein ISN44_As09g002380 [Arabidopsis suecica]
MKKIHHRRSRSSSFLQETILESLDFGCVSPPPWLLSGAL